MERVLQRKKDIEALEKVSKIKNTHPCIPHSQDYSTWYVIFQIAFMTLNYQELAARERIIAEKEALMVERDDLEAKKIRSSHSAARAIVRLSQQINTLEDSIQLRQEGGGVKGRSKDEGAGARDKEQEVAKLMKERSAKCLEFVLIWL